MAKMHPIARSGLMGRLSAKSREELLTLFQQLMQRQPDIEPLVETLIELPLASTAQEKKRPGKGRERTLDPSAIQSQVTSAFYNAGEGWGAASRVCSALDRLCDIGKSFAEAGQWANAQTVYATIAEETVVQYERLHDKGQLSWVLSQCATGLVACLETQPNLLRNERLDAAEREALLTTLFSLWKFGSHYGGIGVDIPTAIAEHTTAHERERVQAWLREEMRPGQDSSSVWHNRDIVDFVVTLKRAGHGSDEEVLEEYRKAGLYKELAEKFLQFGHTNEALAIAQANLVEPVDVIWFAEQLLKSGDEWQGQALAFVETRLKEAEHALQGKPQDFASGRTVDTYRRWLSEKYSQYGKALQALKMELARFQASPDETTYRAVRSATQSAGQSEEVWSDVRPRLIQTLEQQNHWAALVSVYLDEGEVGQALAALARMEQQPGPSLHRYGYSYPSTPGHYHIQVAKAAEKHYPDEAIQLYKRVVQKLIDGRGRENYRQAVDYLGQVKLLCQKQRRETEWQAYVTNLRNSNKNLRALKEELDKRGL